MKVQLRNIGPGIIVLLTWTVLGCDKPQIVGEKALRGNWIELKNPTDTLSFATFLDDKEVIFLKRDILYRTGPYRYEILPHNKISIRWMLSSIMAPNEYYFKVTGDQLSIGNFYDSPSGEVLTFQKAD